MPVHHTPVELYNFRLMRIKRLLENLPVHKQRWRSLFVAFIVSSLQNYDAALIQNAEIHGHHIVIVVVAKHPTFSTVRKRLQHAPVESPLRISGVHRRSAPRLPTG